MGSQVAGHRRDPCVPAVCPPPLSDDDYVNVHSSGHVSRQLHLALLPTPPIQHPIFRSSPSYSARALIPPLASICPTLPSTALAVLSIDSKHFAAYSHFRSPRETTEQRACVDAWPRRFHPTHPSSLVRLPCSSVLAPNICSGLGELLEVVLWQAFRAPSRPFQRKTAVGLSRASS